ncbi:MAG: hypothetical protein JSU00_24655 [Acidobacteria bacterium]|nr:hypothetical protein [Acidobacteriota bacterium]
MSILLIRNAQIAVLDRIVLENWLISHMKRHFRRLCRTLTEPELADFVRHGVARANHYGFTESKYVAKWLNLMALLGRRFDEDPGCSWIAPILAGSQPSAIKMEDLLDAAQRRVWGSRAS